MIGEIKNIIEILKKYEKISEIISRDLNINTKAMCDVLLPFQNLSINEFEKILRDKLDNESTDKVDLLQIDKEDLFIIAKLIYKRDNGINISESDSNMINEYLSNPKQKVITYILESPQNARYQIISSMDSKVLTSKNITFLGLALLNIKIKGSNKKQQKDNLLQMLYKQDQNLKMKDIYISKQI